ncbi:putative cell surface protein [Clostridium botulinum A3 str. Loch Maree]|nr:SdrD B-like domain-containing protein [Clostridium botulinum]ACA54238.1 putative cell surface protein [Clostridium botulinum A3 str. Loch Maree]
MATISGRVVFDRDRSATINAGDSGIANVPVVLQNIATDVRLVVLTDANGNYSFINVPNGSYRIVESYGTPGGVPTPGDFSTAVVRPVPMGVNPPISFVSNPPPGSTNLDCVTPNTLLVTVTGADLTNENFLDGPVIYTPILDTCVSVSNVNLITVADNGTFGFFPTGTPANTGAPVEPYPGVTPDFTYVLPNPNTYTPAGSEYTVQNIMNDALSEGIGAWWRIADHTTGNETGRMMVVNGFNPGAIFFRDVVSVQPNTNYLFSSWILNLFKVIGYPNPELGVRILASNGDVLYSATLGAQIPVNTNAPEWKQIGTVINSQNNTSLTVEFLSEGPEVIGNDYAIDDVALNEVQVPLFTPVKTISTPVANVGETVTYTVTLENTCTSPLTNVFLKDNVPNGLLFVAGSVIVNGVSEGSFDPNVGFTIPNIPGVSTATITFDAVVNAVPTPNPALNTATINYSYTPVEGGIESNFTVDSNTVPLEVRAVVADVGVIKTGSPNPVMSGETLTYTIDVSNLGPGDAQNVVLTDTIPPEITGAEFSTDGEVTFSPWPGSFNIGTLLNQETRTILIKGTVAQVAPGFITNTAEVTSTTPDPNLSNNTSTSVIEVNESTEEADVGVFKSVGLNPVPAGEVVVFPIKVSNFGPADAQNVVLTDTIPPEITGAEFSEDGGSTFSPWTGSLVIGTLLNGETRDILIRGTVSPTAAGIISNTATVTSTTPDPNPSNNTSTVDVEVLAPVVADVSVVKTASPNPVMAGELLTYTINVTNFGLSSAENVVLTDVISPEITGAEFSTNGGGTFNPWPGSLNIGTLPASETRTILIRGIVSPTATGIISNTATVTSTTPDPNPNNNTSTVEVEVIPVVVGEADISVVKTASPNPVEPGEADISVVKTASPNPVEPGEADISVVKTVSPNPVEPGEADISVVKTASPNPVEPGEADISVVKTASPNPVEPGEADISVVKTVSPNPVEPGEADISVVKTASPNPVEPGEADVSVVKTAITKRVRPGDTVVYTIVVSNAGPADAQNVVLTDTIPPEIIRPEFSINGGLTFSPWPGSFDIGTLPAGASITIIIRGKVVSSSTKCKCITAITNTAKVTSTTSDPNLNNNTSTVTIKVCRCFKSLL